MKRWAHSCACAAITLHLDDGKARRPITVSPLYPNHSAPRHPTGQIPEEPAEAHQPRRGFNRAVRRYIDTRACNGYRRAQRPLSTTSEMGPWPPRSSRSTTGGWALVFALWAASMTSPPTSWRIGGSKRARGMYRQRTQKAWVHMTHQPQCRRLRAATAASSLTTLRGGDFAA